MAHWRGERKLGIINPYQIIEPKDGDLRKVDEHASFYATIAIMSAVAFILIIGFML